MMDSPNPPAPINAASVVIPMPIMVAVRIPAIMVRIARGIWMARSFCHGVNPMPRAASNNRGSITKIAGVIQTIPSLAILAFLIPLSGLGQRSAIVAIFLYSILPILRNTYTAILVIDPLLLEAARGMGLTPWQKLRAIQIPLAMRTIMAGIRTATIIGIGITTLAAFIGAGGLGESIITGLQLNNIYLILSGAIPAALLAIVIDMLLARCEKSLIPKGIA